MERKLDYLKKYTLKKDGYVRLVPNDEVDKIDSLPPAWYEVFRHKEIKMRIKSLLEIWNINLATELRNTISYLNDYLVNIELMDINHRYSILYTIKNRQGKVLYYEGRNPLEGIDNEPLKESWLKTPSSIRTFYEKLHNGFYYYASGSMGLVALEDVVYLGDDEFDWSIIDDLEEPLQIGLESSFGFFSNGMGTYIAIDFKKCEDDNATLWSAKDQPEYNINFWDYVDEWITIGFE
ncbi:hypothetical protein [Paenibacillus fonticola]|uniref:hypothetical protein n=1 Tax=Paenibacillus fonticola TaxID=379896 RepID=UPI000374F888|nr:hypothetical protein [Paenibacillus fonticola]